MRLLSKLGMFLLSAPVSLQVMASNLIEDIAGTSNPDLQGICSPLCLETAVSDNLVSVWMIDNSGQRQFLFHYEPDWSRDPKNRPAASQQNRKRYRPVKEPVPASKASSPCGADGWGYEMGEEIFCTTTAGQVMVTGTYIGLGKQLIIPGDRDDPMDAEIKPSIAARNNENCRSMREPAQSQ